MLQHLKSTEITQKLVYYSCFRADVNRARRFIHISHLLNVYARVCVCILAKVLKIMIKNFYPANFSHIKRGIEGKTSIPKFMSLNEFE